MEYTIIETPDADYEQIYPVDKTPAIGKIAENSTVTFVNGDANTFMIGKEYVVGVEDNGRGNAYLEDIRQNAEIRDKEKVHLKLEIQEHNGEWLFGLRKQQKYKYWIPYIRHKRPYYGKP